MNSKLKARTSTQCRYDALLSNRMRKLSKPTTALRLKSSVS